MTGRRLGRRWLSAPSRSRQAAGERYPCQDFIASLIYRRSVSENIPFLAAYRRSLDSGVAAYRRVLDLATDEQRPHLDRYMRAFAYWHFHCRRYRWQDIYPGLAQIDI